MILTLGSGHVTCHNMYCSDYVLFRTHLAKIKCFNLRAEDGLEVNVVLEAQPSALRNREAIRVHQH